MTDAPEPRLCTHCGGLEIISYHRTDGALTGLTIALDDGTTITAHTIALPPTRTSESCQDQP